MVVLGMGINIDFWKRFHKAPKCEKSTHDALVVAKEEKVDTWGSVSDLI